MTHFVAAQAGDSTLSVASQAAILHSGAEGQRTELLRGGNSRKVVRHDLPRKCDWGRGKRVLRIDTMTNHDDLGFFESLASKVIVGRYAALFFWRVFSVFVRPSFCESRSMSGAMRLWMCALVRTR